MAIRGRKPKPPELRLVTNNPGKRPIPGPPPEAAVRGEMAVPKHLRSKRERAIFEDVVKTCWWLGDADIYAIGMFAALQAEYERGPAKMVAARIAQLRAVRSELGLEPSSRSRLGSMKGTRGKEAAEGADAAPPPPTYFD